jgi:predicted metal-binding protein
MGKTHGLETLFSDHYFSDFKWIDPKEIVVAQWVRMKCLFGCSEYGQNASCPPNVPSVLECRQFFSEYNESLCLFAD